jgi:[acyl-carrier-protein] S-malonyltransferase
MTLAILCSGQGPQHPNMFALTGDAPEAADLFAHTATLLGGRDPREIAQIDTDDAVHQNRVGQILCTLQALAATASLRDAWPGKLIVAGYSVGEVAAWSIAGLMNATKTLDLVALRANAMDAATRPGDGLLFVRGLSYGAIENLCNRRDAAVAIVNPGDAYVLGGAGVALDIIADVAKKMGAARIVRLAVKVASHTARLAAASSEFRKILDQTPTKLSLAPNVRLFSGIDGSAVINISAGLDKLAKQISQRVQWSHCLEGCVEAGASAFFELGPGRALNEMAAGVYPEIPARSLDDFRTLQGARAWLSRASARSGDGEHVR